MWRSYKIGSGVNSTRNFYAPTLAIAFDIARRIYGNRTLYCYGKGT